jgi:hypothetical protein
MEAREIDPFEEAFTGLDDDFAEGGEDEPKPVWTPETVADVERILGRIYQAKQMVALIDRQADDAKRPYQRLAENLERFYGPAIEHIARRKLAEDNANLRKPRSSAVFLTGTVKWVKSGGGLVVADEAAAAAWARENGCAEAVRCTIIAEGDTAAAIVESAREHGIEPALTILKTPLSARLKATGELPGGCEIAETTERMAIVFPKDGEER